MGTTAGPNRGLFASTGNREGHEAPQICRENITKRPITVGYSIEFEPDALNDWHKLQSASRERFKKMLAKRLESPRVSSAQVSGFDGNVYRLKLSSDGLRLFYVVIEEDSVIYVVAVGKREDLSAYRKAKRRLG